MEMTTNTFKRALREGPARIGLWLGLADAYVAEALAGTGFDWLLIDGEHAPNDLRTTLAQLQAVAPYPAHPVVRPVAGETALIKQLLDIGAQTLLVPMVETVEQARAVVAATRYPPTGGRGVGSALARSSRWNQIPGYLQRANDEICVLVQVESVAALGNLEGIALTEGVDGVFFGPADLAASMGHLGNPGHPDVQAAIERGIGIVRASGKAAGILSGDQALARRYLSLGARFVAVGVDTTLLVRAATTLAASFRADTTVATPVQDGPY